MTPDAPWRPTGRQAEVYAAIAAAPRGATVLIGYGGAVGGGKTRLLAELAIDLALQSQGSRILVARDQYVDLHTTTLAEFDASERARELVVRRYDSHPVFRDIRASTWPAGVVSRIYFRGLSNWQGIGSEEYGWALIDEAHETSEDAALFLLSRLRHRPEPKWGLVCGFNPWPSWPTAWFMEGKLPKDLPAATAAFVPARIADNPHLRAGYEEMLRGLYPETMVRRLIEGQAGVVEHAIYSQLDASRHLDTPREGTFWDRSAVGVDYGTAHLSAVVLVSCDHTGRYWVRSCWTERGGDVGHLADAVGSMQAMVKPGYLRVRVDPNERAMAKDRFWELANSGDGSRRGRIGHVTRLLNDNALRLVRGAPGIEGLWREMLGYHWETAADGVVRDIPHRLDDDRVAALEYAIEALEGRRIETLPVSRHVAYAVPRQESPVV